MIVTGKFIPRRTVLRGAGAALALPLLDSMVPAFAATRNSAAKPVVRFGAVFMPMGAAKSVAGNIDHWSPKTVGPLELSQALAALEPVRDRALVISGLGIARLGHLSCVDGRDERGVIGTPGGDAGEFVLKLAALEAMTGTALDDKAVLAALLARLDSFGELYLHTDLAALTRLLEDARAERRLSSALAAVEDLNDFATFLRRPTEDLQEALLELLGDPTHIGCGHLRLMLQHGEEYGVRGRLLIAVQRAAWKLLWQGSPEILVTALSGGHRESAVLNVRVDGPLWGLAYVPLIFPRIAGEQVFVNHPDVVSYLREAHVQFLLRELAPIRLDPSRADEFRSVMAELGARQLSATLRYLADGLPIYDVTFHRDRTVEVREP